MANLRDAKALHREGSATAVVSATYQPRKTAEEVERPARPAPRKVPSPVAIADKGPAGEEPAPRIVRRAPVQLPGRGGRVRKPGLPVSAYAWARGLLGAAATSPSISRAAPENDALVAFCSPNCRPESVRKVRNIYPHGGLPPSHRHRGTGRLELTCSCPAFSGQRRGSGKPGSRLSHISFNPPPRRLRHGGRQSEPEEGASITLW